MRDRKDSGDTLDRPVHELLLSDLSEVGAS